MKMPMLVIAVVCFVVAILTALWATHAKGDEPANVKYPHEPFKLQPEHVQVYVFTTKSPKPELNVRPIADALMRRGWDVRVVDVNMSPGLTATMNIRVVPTFTFEHRDGRLLPAGEMSRIEGAAPAAVVYEELRSAQSKLKNMNQQQLDTLTALIASAKTSEQPENVAKKELIVLGFYLHHGPNTYIESTGKPAKDIVDSEWNVMRTEHTCPVYLYTDRAPEAKTWNVHGYPTTIVVEAERPPGGRFGKLVEKARFTGGSKNGTDSPAGSRVRDKLKELRGESPAEEERKPATQALLPLQNIPPGILSTWQRDPYYASLVLRSLDWSESLNLN